ncbi:hypothetical protein [Pontibacter actiniarum]|uniref:hypothetical protein n=1 Tax=Pontibacter actiniarum TaxID=323450 RepID=UPI0012FCAE3A|nr:hypothetical protein [Pontibacter actiniarum]
MRHSNLRKSRYPLSDDLQEDFGKKGHRLHGDCGAELNDKHTYFKGNKRRQVTLQTAAFGHLTDRIRMVL